MAIKQKLISLDEYYHSIPVDKFVLNNYSIFDYNHSREFYNSMITEYEGESINILPKCKCGKLHGEFYQGVRCSKCGTVADTVQYDPVVWAKSFNPELPFLNPTFFYMLNNLLQRDIQYLVGLTNEPRTKGNICIAIARNVLHNERTYSNFIKNIRSILAFVSTIGQYKQDAKARRVLQLLEMWDTKKDMLLSEYLPMINNVLFAVTKTSKGKFVDTGFAEVFDVASTWMRVANDASAEFHTYDKTTAKAVCTLGMMPEFYIKGYLAKKSGIFRKHCYSARSSNTFRCVITSCPGKHKYNELVAPWTTLVSVFRPQVLNKLMKTGKYSYKEASMKIFTAAKKFDQEIADIGEELIREAGGQGIAIIYHRNPTLMQGSAQLGYIIKFSDIPGLNTLQVSQLTMKAPNGDYDGKIKYNKSRHF